MEQILLVYKGKIAASLSGTLKFGWLIETCGKLCLLMVRDGSGMAVMIFADRARRKLGGNRR